MSNPAKRFIEFDSFRIDVAERQLWRDDKLVHITPRVFDILLVLVEKKGETVGKEELMRRVWGDTFVDEGNLNRNVSTLRKILGDDLNEQRYIKTLPKLGYRFTTNLKEVPGEGPPPPGDEKIERLPAVAAESRGISAAGPETENRAGISALRPRGRRGRRRPAAAALLASGSAVLVLGLVLLAWTFNARSERDDGNLRLLTKHEREQLEKYGTASDQARGDYVKGRSLWHDRSAGGLHRATLYLESAVEKDPDFALAHAALADAYAFDNTLRKKAEFHAREALRLAPDLGEPHASLGFVRMFWDWKMAEAEDEFKRSVRLSPNYATGHQWYAINLAATSNGQEALAEMTRALELEPRSLAVNADLCQVLYFLRRYDEAAAQCRRTLEMDANFRNAHFYLYEIYTARGKYEEAVGHFFKAEEISPSATSDSGSLEKLRGAFATGGIRAFWRARIEMLEKISPNGSYLLAQYHARLGGRDEALRNLQAAHDAHDFDFVMFLADPVFKECCYNDRRYWELEALLLNQPLRETHIRE